MVAAGAGAGTGTGTQMVYKFKDGARVPASVTAERVHDELSAVKERHGRLSGEAVTDDVESVGPNHPLGWAFTWDADVGMHRLHLIEAGNLIRCVVVTAIVPEQEEPVRAFSIVREEGETHYEETAIVIQQVDLRAQLMDQVEAEFERAGKKVRELMALIRLL